MQVTDFATIFTILDIIPRKCPVRVKSGDRGGYYVGPSQPIHVPRKWWSRDVIICSWSVPVTALLSNSHHPFKFTVPQLQTLRYKNLRFTTGLYYSKQNIINQFTTAIVEGWHRCLSPNWPGFDPRSGQFSWLRFFQGFFSTVRQMLGKLRPHTSPNRICQHYHKKCHTGINDLCCRRALKFIYTIGYK